MRDDRPSSRLFLALSHGLYLFSAFRCKLLQTLCRINNINMAIIVLFLVCIWLSVYNFSAGRGFSGKNIFCVHCSTDWWENLFSGFPSSPPKWYEFRWGLIHDSFLKLMQSERVLNRCDEHLLSFRACNVCVEATQFGVLRSTRGSRYRTPTLVIICCVKTLLV